jgi:NDP-sugar pyrophosphorylase family protein
MIKEQPGSVAGIIIDDGRWYDIGSVAEYEKINALLAGQG